jgi:anti-sigma B factor antagonist
MSRPASRLRVIFQKRRNAAMRVDQCIRSGVVIIAPKGRLTVETEAAFVQTVRRILDEGRTRLVLNLADVPYIDSSGLGAIAQAYTSAWRRGGELKLLNVKHRNRHLLTVTRLLTVFEVFDSEDQAVRSFGVDPRGRSAINVA